MAGQREDSYESEYMRDRITKARQSNERIEQRDETQQQIISARPEPESAGPKQNPYYSYPVESEIMSGQGTMKVNNVLGSIGNTISY